MDKCVFCELNLERTRIVEESKYTLTILSNPSLMAGHCLVIPKRHVEKLSQMDARERENLFNQTIRVEERLLKKFSGCDIRQNFRPFQRECDFKMNHLHIHLQPREFEDELYQKCQIYERDVFKFLNQKELEEIKNFLLD